MKPIFIRYVHYTIMLQHVNAVSVTWRAGEGKVKDTPSESVTWGAGEGKVKDTPSDVSSEVSHWLVHREGEGLISTWTPDDLKKSHLRGREHNRRRCFLFKLS